MSSVHIPTDTHLVSLKFGQDETIVPAIAIRGDFSNLDLPVTKWSNGKLQFHYISVSKIIKISTKGSTKCRVYFYPNDSDEQYSFDIELQFLAILVTLHSVPSMLMPGLNLYFVDKNKHSTRIKENMPLTSFDFALTLPPLGTDNYNEIQEQLDLILPENFSVPLANVAWDEIVGESSKSSIPESVLFAQSKLFTILMGLTQDNPNAITELLELENIIEVLIDYESIDEEDENNEEENDSVIAYDPLDADNEFNVMEESEIDQEIIRQNDIDDLNERILVGNYLMQILDNAAKRLFASDPSNLPDGNVEIIDNDNMSVYTSEIFNDIIKGSYEQNEIEATKEKYKLEQVDKKRSEAISIWDEDIEDFMKREMRQVYEALKEYSLLDEVLTSFYNNGNENVKMNSRTIIAKIIILATFISKKSKCIKVQDNVDVSTTLILVKILNPHKDTNIWELPALADTLLNYHINYAVDVITMHYNLTHDQNDLEALFVALHSIGHHVLDDDNLKNLSQEEFSKALTDVNNNTQEFREFSQWILKYRTEILMEAEEYSQDEIDEDLDDDSYDEGCPVSDVIENMLNNEESEGISVDNLATMIAYAYPAFSDIECNILGIEPNHPSWDMTRRIFIQRLLDGFIENYGPRKKDISLR